MYIKNIIFNSVAISTTLDIWSAAVIAFNARLDVHRGVCNVSHVCVPYLCNRFTRAFAGSSLVCAQLQYNFSHRNKSSIKMCVT